MKCPEEGGPPMCDPLTWEREVFFKLFVLFPIIQFHRTIKHLKL